MQELETMNIEVVPADERLAALWERSKAAIVSGWGAGGPVVLLG